MRRQSRTAVRTTAVHEARPARPLAALAGAACLAVLAGCGGGSGGESVTTEALTPTAAMERVASSVKSVETSSYTFEMGGAGLAMKGHGAFRTKPEPAMQMVFDSMSMGGGSAGGLNLGSLGGMEQRIIGDTLYLRGGMLGMLGGSSSKWMKISFGELGKASGMDLESMLTQATQADPRAQLQALLAAGDVQSVGTETIDGVKTTHYVGEVDAADLAGSTRLDAETRSELEKAYTAAKMGATHLDVWVDESYQARRFVSTSKTPVGDVTMTMNFSDYGKPVEIAAPPADEVVDMSSLTERMAPALEEPATS